MIECQEVEKKVKIGQKIIFTMASQEEIEKSVIKTITLANILISLRITKIKMGYFNVFKVWNLFSIATIKYFYRNIRA